MGAINQLIASGPHLVSTSINEQLGGFANSPLDEPPPGSLCIPRREVGESLVIPIPKH